MKICIMGTPVRCLNRGVMALGASLVELCLTASPNNEVVLLVGNRDNQPECFRVGGEHRIIPVVNARMSLRCRLHEHFLWILLMSVAYRLFPLPSVRAAICRATPWVRTVVESDLVGDIRGGDSFSDIYGMKGFLLGFFLVSTVLLVKGSIVQFPQTYGPYRSLLARMLARFILRHSSIIIARDQQSRKVAQELVGPAKEVLLSPDVAFALESVRPEHFEVDPPLSGPVPAGVIGLNVNGLMYHGGFTRKNMFGLRLDFASFLPRLVDALLREHPGELWLVPHTFAAAGSVESDPQASREVREALPPALQTRVRIIAHEYSQYEIKGVIGQCDFFIGSRMHACIAALSQGVPCVGIAYSPKFAGVFQSVGMEDWVVDGREVTSEQALTRVIALYRRRNSVREGLAKRAGSARLDLDILFRRLMAAAKPLSD